MAQKTQAGWRGMGLFLALAFASAHLTGCGLLPPPITMASPKKKVARAIETFIAKRDTLFVLPAQVDYEKRGLWLPVEDSTATQAIADRVNQELCDYMRSQWQKEIVLVQDPILQSQLLADTSQTYFQLWVDGFSRTPIRRVLADVKSFVLMGPTLGYNMNCPIGTSSDMVLVLRRGGPKTKTLFRQKDEDDINPSDPADLRWQVRRLINPQYSEG
jgi:hypothetical protein